MGNDWDSLLTEWNILFCMEIVNENINGVSLVVVVILFPTERQQYKDKNA